MDKLTKSILVTAAGGLIVSATLNSISLATRVSVVETQQDSNELADQEINRKLDTIIGNQGTIKTDLAAIKSTVREVDKDQDRIEDKLFN